jgi:UPF0755 protein
MENTMSNDGLVPVLALDAGSFDDGRSFIGRYGAGRRMSPQSPNEALQPEAPPPPPPKPPSKRRPTLSALSGFLSFLVIVAIGALGAMAWGSNRLQEPGPLTTDKVIFIAPHTDLPDIIDKLSAENVIDSPLTFNMVLAVERKRGKVRAGEYLFKQHASLRQVVDTLVNGKQILHAITIPEGLTSAQIVQRLRDNDVLVGDIHEIPKEGSLLPETYKVARGASRGEVLQKMQDDDRRVVEQIWARRSPDLPLRSPYELVTLASVVEKETGKADERPRVAGVFINRLQKRMRLQSDPTIVYGLVGGQGTLGHSITRSELDKKTPYNTYQIDGLPPGPIDNPGRAALEAVANPSRTSDLYFVADGTGGHAFASTVDEHNRNVVRWRQIERDAKDKLDVDKLAPTAATPPRPNQRSDASDAIYGTLPASVGSISLGHLASFLDPASNHDIATMSEAANRVSAPSAGVVSGRAAAPVRLDEGAMTTSIDTTGFAVQGAQPDRSAILDGPSTPDPEPIATAPAPRPGSSREARAALDAPPSDHPVDLFADPDPAPASSARPTKVPPMHPKIFDASEGTAIDPLRNKSYDLNTAKTIPGDLAH